MITIVNKDNSTQYNNLYRKAERALGLEEYEINTLEKYFYYLPDLMDLTGEDDSKYSQTLGRRYAILPLDEAYFNILANERIIEVPAIFRQNGIAVQGDETAEIIYFKINRYFDFMDLNNTDIYIQWSRGENDNGLSNEWVRDIESDPDYLIFGWALDSSITEIAGPLKFSVRFIDWKRNAEGEIILNAAGEKEIGYSLSTLEATAIINKGLDLNISPTNINEIEHMISSRVKRSRVVGADVADLPVYTLNLLNWVKSKEGENYGPSNGNYEVDLDSNNEYEFKIQAYSSDGGKITYHWYDINNSKKIELTGVDEYKLVEGSEENPVEVKQGHIYYTLEDGKYIPDSNLTPGTDVITDLAHYERYGCYKANKAGKYIGVAKNDIKYNSAVLPNLESNTIPEIYGPILIPGPLPATITLSEGQFWDGYILGNEDIVLSPVITKGNEKDKLSYQWYRQWETAEKEEVVGEIKEDITIKANEALQGNYILKVISKRNNIPEEVFSQAFVVTNPAAKPIVSYSDTSINSGDTVEAIVTFGENDYQNGKNVLTYQWCKVVSADGELQPVANATGKVFRPTEAGSYKCEVTNTYNKDSITDTSGAEVKVY